MTELKELQAKYDTLLKIISHILPDKSGMYFISGQSGENDVNVKRSTYFVEMERVPTFYAWEKEYTE